MARWISWEDPDRGTGRTTRELQKAIAKSEELGGARVYYITMDSICNWYVQDLLRRLNPEYGPYVIPISMHSGRVVHDGTSWHIPGFDKSRVFVDHAVFP